MGDVDPARVRTLYDHLAATAERPVSREATHYLAEAEAVASDAVAAAEEGRTDVVRTRLSQVERLLGEVDETGNSEADDHLEAAASLAADLRSCR